MTIVPSSHVNQSGDAVSYVLVVSPPDGDSNKTNNDLSVFDFKEEKRGIAVAGDGEGDDDVGDEDDNAEYQGIDNYNRFSSRPLQTQSQALMCNYCNYTSHKRYLLTRHMKTHSEERPHKCNICDRGFKTISSLQNHVNTHTGIKPHKCKECDSSFTTSGSSCSRIYS